MPAPIAHREHRDSTPARWDPWRDIVEMRQRMDRLVEQFMGGTAPDGDGAWAPPIDLEETDDAWIVEAEIPGVKKDDVTVELRDNELEIHGECKENKHAGHLHRHARRTGRFDYRVTLPGELDTEHDMDAKLSDGVLRVRVPKGEHSQPRRAEIKTG